MPTPQELSKTVFASSSSEAVLVSPSARFAPRYRYGLQRGVVKHGSTAALPRDVPTLAERLRARGYATAAVGKWRAARARFSVALGRRVATAEAGHRGDAAEPLR